MARQPRRETDKIGCSKVFVKSGVFMRGSTQKSVAIIKLVGIPFFTVLI